MISKWISLIGEKIVIPSAQVMALAIVQLVGFVIAIQLIGFATPGTGKGPRPNDTEISSHVEDEAENTTTADNSKKGRSKSASSTEQLKVFGLLILACILNAAAMVFWIRQTDLGGIRLIVGTFLTFFFCMAVMPQSDTFLFLRNQTEIIRSAGYMGLIVSLVFSIASVPVFWRWKSKLKLRQGPAWKQRSFVLVWPLVICTLLYVVVYVVFGYFVAWQSPELRRLYGGGDTVLGFWERITTPPTSNRVIPFQILRGLVWTALCAAMIRVSQGSRIRVALSVGLVLALVMNSQLLLPNPIMSQNIRLTHAIETAASNLIFGVLCVWIWTVSSGSRD